MRQFEALTADPAATEARFRRTPITIGLWTFAIVLMLALIAGVAITVNAFIATETAYRRNAVVLAEAVAQSVEQPLARAAEFDVPLGKLPDGTKFLAGILANAPALAKIEIRDASDKTLFVADVPTRLATSFMVARVTVKGRSGPAGSVLATASLNQATQSFLAAAIPTAASAGGLALIAGLIAGLVTHRMVARPAQRAIIALRRVSQGDIALRVPPRTSQRIRWLLVRLSHSDSQHPATNGPHLPPMLPNLKRPTMRTAIRLQSRHSSWVCVSATRCRM